MLGSASTADSGVKVSSRILERYLLRGEDVVVATRQHWGKMIEPASVVIAGFVVISWLSITLERATGSPALFLWWGWLALVGRLLWKMLEWRNEWFVTTDKRLLLTYGLFTHKVAMMPLGKVTDLNYGRSLLGRIIGFGTFTLESAGQDQALRQINWVPEPDVTYREICDIIFGPERYDDEDSLPEEHEEWRLQGARRPPAQAERDDDPSGGQGWTMSAEDSSPYVAVENHDGEDETGPIPPPR